MGVSPAYLRTEHQFLKLGKSPKSCQHIWGLVINTDRTGTQQIIKICKYQQTLAREALQIACMIICMVFALVYTYILFPAYPSCA